VQREIHDAILDEAHRGAGGIELFHGYTYSGHPLACAAGLATLELYEREDLFARAAAMSDYWADAVHSLRDVPTVVDLRSLGLVAGIEVAPRDGKPGARAYDAFVECFRRGLLVRVTGDIIALSPPLIAEKSHVDEMFSLLADVLKKTA
jgi:beta-alanine--pyruvate transaminase